MIALRRPRAAAPVLAALLLASCGHGRAVDVHGAGVDCPSLPVRVVAAVADEATLACEGAGLAAAFLEQAGFGALQPVDIVLADRLPEAVRPGAVACYAQRDRRITVLHYARFEARGRWFGLKIEPALFRSVVAHEVAHAAAACAAGAQPLSLPAHEYIAYVAMLATMPAPLRERVLAALPGTGFDALSQINAMVYAIDPEKFGVEAYRHWRSLDEPWAFLRQVVGGQAILDVPLGD